MLHFWVRFGVVYGCLAVAAVAATVDPLVVSAQNTLRDEGVFPYHSTGAIDARTVAAIRHYQILQGLQVTGQLDLPTLSAMHLKPTPPPAELIAEDRQFLKDLTPRPAPAPPEQPPAAVAQAEVAEKPSPDEDVFPLADESTAQTVAHRHERSAGEGHRSRHRRHR